MCGLFLILYSPIIVKPSFNYDYCASLRDALQTFLRLGRYKSHLRFNSRSTQTKKAIPSDDFVLFGGGGGN